MEEMEDFEKRAIDSNNLKPSTKNIYYVVLVMDIQQYITQSKSTEFHVLPLLDSSQLSLSLFVHLRIIPTGHRTVDACAFHYGKKECDAQEGMNQPRVNIFDKQLSNVFGSINLEICLTHI
ncbi:hypothetical protein NQ315_013325 [Exocentrus adspersus]|uniref:Uncharacterized protein n=1 Tax=Exocentrus adspersus TaxID=1586481 RepID=A0AAV8V6L3_9CUCU|nr:hypothetical protein NQ315_013325 [Exocentrus adspersus]